MDHINNLISSNKSFVIYTNNIPKVLGKLKKINKKSVFLRQSTRPLSPISYFIKEHFDQKKLKKVSRGFSKDVSNYLISLFKGKSKGIDSFFEEYFDRTEFVLKRNELYLLIAKYFAFLVKSLDIECIVMIVNNQKLFTSTLKVVEKVLKLLKGRQIIIVEYINDFENSYFYSENFELHTLIFEQKKEKQNSSTNYDNLKLFEEYYNWMCWEVCENLGTHIITINPKLALKESFIKKLTFSLVGVNKIDDAIDYFLDFIEEMKEKGNLVLLSSSNRILTYLYAISQSRWKLAGTTAKKTYEFAIRSKNQKEILLSKALMFFIGLMNDKECLEFFEDLEKNKKKFKKLYSYITVFYYFYISMRDIIGVEKILSLANESGKMFKRKRNNFYLILYYHFLANVFIELGNHNEAIRFDLKALKIGKYLNTPNISHIYNSLSHIYYTTDNFEKALNFSAKSLDESIKEMDLKEICMSLVNIVYIYLITGNYSYASEIMDLLMTVKHKAGIHTLPIHSNVKLWVMDIYTKSKLGESSRFINNLFTLNNQDIGNLDKEGKGFYYWGLSIVESDFDKKIKFLKKALDYITQNEFKYIEVKILRDLIQALSLTGRTNEIKELTQRILEIRKKDHPLYEAILQSDSTIVKLKKIKIPKNLVIQQSTYQKQLILLQSKKNYLKFLNKLQQLMIRENSESDLITKFINIMKNSFLVEKVIFFDRDKKKIYSIPEILPEESYYIENIRNFNEKHIENTENETPFKYGYILPIMFSNKEIKGALILTSSNKESFLDEDQISIIKISSLLLSTKLEIIKHSSRIEKMAKIDFLTGVASRVEMDNILIRELEKCKRIPNYYFSIAIIDLDNFKYYNDNFGHIIGDMILREFAKLLSSQVRKIDFVCRFGGDEFVVIMPYTTKEKAILAGKRWMKIFDTNFYENVILSYKGEKPIIPTDKKLGMSIGVSNIIEANYDIEKLISIADQRLYLSKKSSLKIH